MSLYDTDYVEWSQRTAELIRTGRLDEVELDNVAEEIESLGRSDKRQLRNRVRIVLVHLLKSAGAPDEPSPSWRATILEQRTRIQDLLEDSPSLRATVGDVVAANYVPAVQMAALQMQQPADSFPVDCPYTADQILDPEFLP